MEQNQLLQYKMVQKEVRAIRVTKETREMPDILLCVEPTTGPILTKQKSSNMLMMQYLMERGEYGNC
jgi:hypothetical protein